MGSNPSKFLTDAVQMHDKDFDCPLKLYARGLPQGT